MNNPNKAVQRFANGTVPVSARDGAVAAQRNEARLFCLQIVRDEQYREKLLALARRGLLNPAVEQMLWAYAYGKPPDRIVFGFENEEESLEDLSVEQLRDRVQNLAVRLVELSEPAPSAPAAEHDQAAAEAVTDLSLLRRIKPALVETPPVPSFRQRALDLGARLAAAGLARTEADEAEAAAHEAGFTDAEEELSK